MRVLVPAEELRTVLASRRRLEQRWASDSVDAMLLLQTLQTVGPTLEDVLGSGFITLDDDSGDGALLTLRHRAATGLVDALNGQLNQVRSPRSAPRHVAAVAVRDVRVHDVPAVRRPK